MAARNEPEKPAARSRYSEDRRLYRFQRVGKDLPTGSRSEQLENFLRARQDLMISELCITEVVSAAARRKREGRLNAKQVKEIHDAMLADAESGYYRRLGITPGIHRDAERMLLSTEAVPVRTLDALHIALALSGLAEWMVTFDVRMANAALVHGLEIVEFT